VTLRPYQLEAVEAVENGWKEFRKQLLVAPTGSGKTIMFSALANRALPDKTLILAHRDELIEQAVDKLHQATGIIAEKEKAEFTASVTAPVVVASVQSMVRRLDNWPATHFGTVIIDEAHHALAGQWRTVLQHFDPYANVLGVTATPDRGDKKNLGQYFENVPFQISLVDLIRQRFLCPITIQTVPLALDISDVRQTAGDYNEADLGEALEPYLKLIAQALARIVPFRRTLAFLPLIATSQKFVAACNAAGLNARHIDGNSPDRAEILAAYARNEFDLLSNSALLLEGFDDPEIDCVLMLRPTQSRPLYAQAIGRGTRTAEGKKNLLVLDFLWQSSKHNLVRPAHLIAETPEIADAMTEAANAKAERGETQGNLDLLGLLSEAKAKREAALRKQLEENRRKQGRTVDAIEFCLKLGASDLADYEATMKWEHQAPTEKQTAALEKFGIDGASVQNRGHASKLLDLAISRAQAGLASFRQIRLLEQFGFPNAKKATRETADAFLNDKLGERRPAPRRQAA
jgi:superfamily II DNA or RNA helicase